jgi:hypothetical protein
MRPIIFLALLAVALAVVTGCGFVSSVDRIYGKYTLQISQANVELELTRDMKFKETINFLTGQTTVVTGNWTFDIIDSEGDVGLDGVARLSEAINPQAIDRIDTEMEAQKWFGNIRLCADANANLYFVKMESR